MEAQANHAPRVCVSVIVPTLNPGPATLRRLFAPLRAQRGVAVELIVIDLSSTDGSHELLAEANVSLTIRQDEFDHGGARNLVTTRAMGDLLISMTQDARPTQETTLARLAAPVLAGRAAAAYARQVAPPSAPVLERIARELSYPPEPALHSLDVLPRIGIRTFMLSNVASVVDRQAFVELGGFPDRTIFHEDLYLANAILRSGGRIAYVADAVVEHGHTYSLTGLMRRNRDNASPLANAPEPLRSAPAGGAGARFALAHARTLITMRRYEQLPRWVLETGARWVGLGIGRARGETAIRERGLVRLRVALDAITGIQLTHPGV